MKPEELALSLDLPKRSVALVLAGGRGSRLKNLTDRRAKPAVYFGGKFRIIDFALSNCLNSGIRRIGVITQYKSHSLMRHLQRGWAFLKSEMNEFVDLMPAQQRVDEESWYRGTADAVYQNIDIIESYGPEYMVILAGDHVYKMNYNKMVRFHVENNADVTLGLRYDWYANSDKPRFNQFFLARNGFDNTENLDGKGILQPRFGFKWDVTDDLRLRGGAGLFAGGNPNVWMDHAVVANDLFKDSFE